MTNIQFAGLTGFAFVAAWIGLGFGYALLCLVGAAVAMLAVAVRAGQLDLGELQQRIGGSGDARFPDISTPVAKSPRKPRVQ